ncbi:Sugar tr and/or MFS 1 domain containing protein [Asbolus verrucosus]|uniref:Sugar tr and/or MFS 1 domain containing protein n=1 Tax=Asbolus verrucosus TaxID=1661398 RepID=A0A482VUE9_ASBVE|nr:Sugar tr and/or MFS 1 domain containing protein [Asbolus verrucosus]
MQLPHNHGRLFQYLATFSGAFSIITSGINLGWTSPYLPKLLDPDSPIPTTNDEGSWCAVAPLLGSPVGALMAAILGDLIGRKNTTLLMTPIIFFSFIGIAFADSIFVISAIRFIVGATEGALYTVLPMYIGEISDPQIRGFLTSTLTIAGIAGTLFINIIGQMYSIFSSSLICSMVPLIHFATFVWMPESPYYYIKKHQLKEAENSLKTLRGSEDVEEEMDALCKAVTRQEQNKKAKITDLFTVASNRKACCIYIIICLTNKFSGKNPCLFYTTMIFEEAGSRIDSELSVIIYCSVELVATLVAIVVVDKFGKRPLLIVSTVGCSVSVFSLATYFYLKDLFPDFVQSFDWLPITSLVAYNILFSIGLAFGAVTVLSELFPTSVKAVALGTADTFSVSMGAFASKFFQITKDEFGMYVPFWCFAICCAVGLVFIVKFVPETKGKTLEEIQQYLIGENDGDSKEYKKSEFSV